MDSKEGVRTVQLACPLCEAEGKSGPVRTPATHVWVPALLRRWIPKWAQEKGFLSLEEAIPKAPALAALIKERNGRKEAEWLCADHGKTFRTAKIWTEKLFVVMRKQAAAAERREKEAFGSIASILAGKQALARAQSPVLGPDDGDDAGAQARAEQKAIMRKLTAAAAREAEMAADSKPTGKGRKAAKGSTKGRGGKSDLRKQIDQALLDDDED